MPLAFNSCWTCSEFSKGPNSSSSLSEPSPPPSSPPPPPPPPPPPDPALPFSFPLPLPLSKSWAWPSRLPVKLDLDPSSSPGTASLATLLPASVSEISSKLLLQKICTNVLLPSHLRMEDLLLRNSILEANCTASQGNTRTQIRRTLKHQDSSRPARNLRDERSHRRKKRKNWGCRAECRPQRPRICGIGSASMRQILTWAPSSGNLQAFGPRLFSARRKSQT